MVSPIVVAAASAAAGPELEKKTATQTPKTDGKSKRALRRQRKKQSRQELRSWKNGVHGLATNNLLESSEVPSPIDENDAELQVHIEYVPEKIDVDEPLAMYFGDVFERFAARGVPFEEPDVEIIPAKPEAEQEDSDDDESDSVLSQRQLRKLNRLQVAELKQLAPFPEVVDVHDVCSSDPALLVQLKSLRTSVPVPGHWSQKRKYLQGKRGQEKSSFKLPDYIEATGISAIRQAHQDQDQEKKAKTKQRERMQPKMNRLDIDYQVLHDAFFRNQPKMKTAVHGDIYYEGKEFQVNVKTARPGVLSQALKEALGIREGFPPPWLINMQRYGPPPSYRNLKIPGLNAPLPSGASYGYGDGQWGKPPVDHLGNPLYGDPFGQSMEPEHVQTPIPDQLPWGELVVEEEEEEIEEEEEDDMEQEEDVTGTESVVSFASGMVTPDEIELRKGVGLETPEIDLRKQPAKQLYQVLEQKEMAMGGDALYGSSHTYKIPTATSGSAAVASQLSGDQVEIALAPEELGSMDEAALSRRYQEQLEAVKALRSSAESVSDVVLEETRKRKRKEEAKSKTKKFKDFKF